MIYINKDGFSVQVNTTTPVEDWLEMVHDLVDLLSSEEMDRHVDRHWSIELLRQMLPQEPADIKRLCEFGCR